MYLSIIIYFLMKYTSLNEINLEIKIYKTIILPVVLYGCETWSFTLKEERKLRVFENRIQRRIFGPMRDENGNVQGLTMRKFIVFSVHLI